MIIDLSNKTAIVTGSTSGIGFAIAQGLAQSGAALVLNGRTQAAVDAAVSAVQANTVNAEVRGVAADLRDRGAPFWSRRSLGRTSSSTMRESAGRAISSRPKTPNGPASSR